MKRLRIFAAVVLCVSLLAFAGCGENTNTDNIDKGTVTEETTNTDNNGTGNDDSVTEDMASDARDAVDDVEDSMDGSGNSRDNDTKGTGNN